jgi:glucosylceramidase
MAELPVPAVITECTGGDWDPSWTSTFAWQARNLVVDAIKYGSEGLILWNLALDPNRGPHKGGCSNCRGIVTIDPTTGTWQPEPEYYLLAQLTRAADPQARILGVATRPDVPSVAFKNADGTVGVFGHNASGVDQVVSVTFGGSEATRVRVRAGDLFSLRGRP